MLISATISWASAVFNSSHSKLGAVLGSIAFLVQAVGGGVDTAGSQKCGIDMLHQGLFFRDRHQIGEGVFLFAAAVFGSLHGITRGRNATHPAPILRQFDQVGQVCHAPADTIQLVAHDGADFLLLHIADHPLKIRPIRIKAAFSFVLV